MLKVKLKTKLQCFQMFLQSYQTIILLQYFIEDFVSEKVCSSIWYWYYNSDDNVFLQFIFRTNCQVTFFTLLCLTLWMLRALIVKGILILDRQVLINP